MSITTTTPSLNGRSLRSNLGTFPRKILDTRLASNSAELCLRRVILSLSGTSLLGGGEPALERAAALYLTLDPCCTLLVRRTVYGYGKRPVFAEEEREAIPAPLCSQQFTTSLFLIPAALRTAAALYDKRRVFHTRWSTDAGNKFLSNTIPPIS